MTSIKSNDKTRFTTERSLRETKKIMMNNIRKSYKYSSQNSFAFNQAPFTCDNTTTYPSIELIKISEN